ncbi:ATPase P-type K/Mg/Cd/Cu/Zn/Na/Ca/Na/H-transporter [Penicillium bovifimosum]|uniref:Calcium-transporting ATPase n=1 Tax=Penicillium bovifimosum TaxID=126998 RepID=A0A9W9H148_9EURO|nr:ATPase P-type K/Mg/Cd/Cu/Zn/Na/Ca/Na/H-transporter [Penicillium bovifimosum]KAJ5135625.1 ATPase P-type K/Mg/Cd/Cu/Zn/Na/Ca/Na/H-transporter [Penicillium bovifimosum]
MSDTPPNESAQSSTPLRRERAPTITIDTSAVNSPDTSNPPMQVLSGGHSQTHSDANDTTTLLNNGSPTDLRSASSIRSNASSEARDRESRPTSPHNISSPKTKAPEAHSNFLSVPGTRSRGNSLESDETGQSSSTYGGETYVTSASQGSRSDLAKNTFVHDDDALTPDPGRESEFEVEDNRFAFSPGQLNKLLNPKSFSAFYALGGLRGLEKGLRTDTKSGLSVDETTLDGTVSFDDVASPKNVPKSFSPKTPPHTTTEGSVTTRSGDGFVDRKRIFGDNKLPERKLKTIWELAWIAYNDKVLILLTIAAAVSLAVGIPQSLHPANPDEPGVEWVEGLAILVAIIIVVSVGAVNDWQKERQFAKLNKKKENRLVKVTRSGRTEEISVHDVLVGDVLLLEPGDMVPVDGILIDCHDLKCDESSATGESDILRKTPGDEVYRTIEQQEDLKKMDPFIISGAKVTEGVGSFLVTSTGTNSTHGRTMMSLQEEGETTPLQTKLNVLAEYIAKLGLASGLLLFIVLFIKFLVRLKDIEGGADAKGQAFLQIFIVAVTIVVVAVPEGLPLAVTLALAFATTRMIKDNNLVRYLKACETMGNATTICSDKTGTLTENIMTAVAATLGTTSRFGKYSGISPDDRTEISPSEFVSTLASPVKEALSQSIIYNSTAFEGETDGVKSFVGSKTETALLSFARDYLGMGSLQEERANGKLVQMYPFDSGRKCMAVVVQLDNGKFRMLVKGAAEILVAKSTRIVRDPAESLSEAPMTDDNRSSLDTIMTTYASRSLRCISLVYRDFDQWPPRGAPVSETDRNQAVFEPIFKDMVMLGIFGIQDPVRAGVPEAVYACQRAGVFVRMVTGDNIMTAKAIAQECGIYTPGGIAIEGPKFRKLSTRQMNQIIPRLQVIARSSPDDKKILVNQLKKLGETVAVTGDGTNDAQALKNADVGFAMGITGTEVAKEASDIILMDDNFSSIVKAMAWGRTVCDAVKKFLQFQITVNITAVILTFVSAVASDSEDSVLSAVQLLWVNLIMDTFAALALATDPPTPTVLDRRPESKSDPLITLTMWKMIIGQSIYQLVVTFILNFAGGKIFSWEHEHLQTVVFNTFVFMQIFNQYNSRRIDNKLNIMERIWKNKWFIGIQVIIIGGQVLIIFVGGAAFSVKRLDQGSQWAVSLVLGAISLPIAVIIRLIPDEFVRSLIPNFWHRNKGPELVISDEDRNYEWNPALEEIRDQLAFIKRLRGGRLRNIRHKLQHPQEFLPRSRSGSRSRDSSSSPPTPVPENDTGSSSPQPSPESRSRRSTRSRSNSTFGPAAAMAGVVAGSIAGWSPIERPNGEGDVATFPTTGGPHSGLDREQGIEVHPDTAADDRILNEYSANSKTPPSQNPDLTPFFEHAPPVDRAPSSRGRRSLSQRSRSSTSHSHV